MSNTVRKKSWPAFFLLLYFLFSSLFSIANLAFNDCGRASILLCSEWSGRMAVIWSILIRTDCYHVVHLGYTMRVKKIDKMNICGWRYSSIFLTEYPLHTMRETYLRLPIPTFYPTSSLGSSFSPRRVIFKIWWWPVTCWLPCSLLCFLTHLHPHY